MTVLICHNFYQRPGGEDGVYHSETTLLRRHDHRVVQYEVHNDDVAHMGRLQLAAATVWNHAHHRDLRRLIRRERPDVVHVHNTLPLLSPAVYYAARAEGVPVVQTLHNYRLCCPKALLFRDAAPCEDCVGRAVAWPAIVHRCYRQDRAATTAVTTMLAVHRGLGTWRHGIDAYIALSEFARRLFVRQGLPEERIFVKRNVVIPDPGLGDGRDGGVVFVGRLSPEKGLDTLLTAWNELRDVPLTLAGDGPMAPRITALAARNPAIRVVGHLSGTNVLDLIGRAACLVCPSEWYEGCPLVVAEAFARGTPVLASRIGALEEMVSHDVTGVLFRPGDAQDLAANVRSLLGRPAALAAMRRAARADFDARFSEGAGYDALMQVYRHAMRLSVPLGPVPRAIATPSSGTGSG